MSTAEGGRRSPCQKQEGKQMEYTAEDAAALAALAEAAAEDTALAAALAETEALDVDAE